MGQGGRRQCKWLQSGTGMKKAVYESAEWDREEEGSVGVCRMGQGGRRHCMKLRRGTGRKKAVQEAADGSDNCLKTAVYEAAEEGTTV